MAALRTPTALLAVIVAGLAVAGVGFAAFSANAYVNGTATAGTFGPFSWSLASSHGYGTYDHCGVSITETNAPADTIELTASNLAPGDFCGYSADLSNAGSLPGTISESLSASGGGLCGELIYSDNGFTPGVTIGSGGETGGTSYPIPGEGTISWGGTLLLPSGAGNAGEGGTCTFSVTVTGVAGT